MQSHISYKKNIFVFFSFGVSLNVWDKKKILDREVEHYKKLQKNDFNLSFVTYGDKSDLLYQKKLKNIKIIPIFKKIKKNFITKYLIIFFASYILKSELKKCDIIKTHQVSGGLIAVICAILNKKKLIVRAGWEPTKNSKKWGIGLFKYILFTINSLISYKFSNKIITTSKELKKFIKKTYFIKNEKIIVIPNSLDMNKFKKSNKNKKNRVINISRLEKQKNLFQLLNICKSANLDLDIIGEGSQLNELKRYAREIGVNVKFLGQINNDKLPKILSKYIFYISTSKIEGSPKTIMEAMSVELPIFGLKADGLNSLIRNHESGYLATDTNKLANKLKKIKKDHTVLRKMGKKARIYAYKNFSLQKNIITEKKIFKDILNEK